MIGRTIQSFEIKKSLGEGGMASVYLAENDIGKQVAIKVLHTKYFHDEAIRERFVQEARIMATLEHEHICSAIALEDNAAYSAIIMDYMEGQDLEDYVKTHGKVEEDTVWNWLGQMTAALDYAHLQGIVHRDLKPANFFLTNDGQIKVMDFGIAKAAESAVKTGTGMYMGSPSYMSPEQIRSAKQVDYRTDLYSLGVTLHTLLNGQSPYAEAEDSAFDLNLKIVSEPLPKLPHLSTEMQALLDILLAKSKDDRRIAVGGLKKQVTTMRPIHTEPTDPEETVVKPPKKRQPLWLWTGVLLLLLGIGAGWYYTMGQPKPRIKAELTALITKAIREEGNTANLNHIDTSLITDMSGLFEGYPKFNGQVDQWDVSNVTTMKSMFSGAKVFNQDIGSWDTSNVTTMRAMFESSEMFNQDISGWDTSSVTDMSEMFLFTEAFNQDISRWDVSNVTTMSWMFADSWMFNQDIGGWDVSNVTTMRAMFSEAEAFNQDISGWNVKEVEDWKHFRGKSRLPLSHIPPKFR